MNILPIKSPAELIEDIRAKLSEKPDGEGAAYALIVGAGFSYGVMPMTEELMRERIGDYYYYENVYEGDEQVQRLCREYWKEFNAASVESGEPTVQLDRHGLPLDPAAAYQLLFTHRALNAFFALAPVPSTYIDRLKKSRPVEEPKMRKGEKFGREFLKEMLGFGGDLSDKGGKADQRQTGPGKLNDAHRFLALLLKLQETGKLSELRPFCRTIFTTNFDTLLPNALQFVQVDFRVIDQPEHGLEPADFQEQDGVVRLVYTHGSVLRDNTASAVEELANLSRKNAGTISQYLGLKDVLVFGYGGWQDSLMSA